MHTRRDSVFFHQRFLALVDRIERTFAVVDWHYADVPVWPLARMELYLDMHFSAIGAARPAARRFPYRSLARAALPLRNLWRSRRDLQHLTLRPHRAGAIVLGDGVTLDCLDGAWCDRFAEPIIAALAAQGQETFLMQSGDLRRLPWRRATYPANLIAAHGAQLAQCAHAETQLADHGAVLEFLTRQGVVAPSLERGALQRLAALTEGTATSFERVLETVKPALAFVVTYYSGLAPAFVLACRRRRILSVDLQHCPQEGSHKAYNFAALPARGYAVLPDVFWNWTQRDAEHNNAFAVLAEPGRHRAIHGGHNQIAALRDAGGAIARHWQRRFAAVAGAMRFEREILVALQPIGGHRQTWQALRAAMDAAPPGWRWWIRRHPATGVGQDAEFAGLLDADRQNVVVEGASRLPLPVLLEHMSALVSLASGAAVEAAAFGVPALFLDATAHDTFAALIESGAARVVEVGALNSVLANSHPRRRLPPAAPTLAVTLQELRQAARRHGALPGCFQPYNFTRPDRYPWLFEFARERLGHGRPLRVLSFGCSRGDEVFTLQQYLPYATIRGIDVDARNIAYCRRRVTVREAEAVTFATAASTQGEPDACYDAIFCLAVLCCGDLTVQRASSSAPRLLFADFERVVTDLVRCLKPGGLLFLHTSNFRFCDTGVFAQCEVILQAEPAQMAPDLLYDRDNRLLPGMRYRDVGFRKKH